MFPGIWCQVLCLTSILLKAIQTHLGDNLVNMTDPLYRRKQIHTHKSVLNMKRFLPETNACLQVRRSLCSTVCPPLTNGSPLLVTHFDEEATVNLPLFHSHELFFSLSHAGSLVNGDGGWGVPLKELRYLNLIVAALFPSLERHENPEVTKQICVLLFYRKSEASTFTSYNFLLISASPAQYCL